jgi:2,3-dihydroxybenzoate-AMP ligase
MLAGCTPWPDDLVRTYRERGYWRDVSIAQHFANHAAASPDRVALIDGATRHTLGNLLMQSERLAAHLHALGLRSRQIVVFQLPNSAEFLVTFLALMRLGVIPVMALPSHRQTEIEHYVRASGAVALFIADRIRDFDFRAMAREIRSGQPALRHVFVKGEAGPGDIAIHDLLASDPPATSIAAMATAMPEPSDVALMLLSGGTTALPKLIPRTHNDYVYNFEQSARVAGFGPQTVQLMVLPMGHNYNLGSPGMLGAISAGGRVVIAPKADTASCFGLIARERVTTIPGAVPLFVNWLNDPTLSTYDFSSLQSVQNGGARLSPELRNRIRKTLRCQYQEVYGTAEGLLNLSPLDADDETILTSSGQPMCADDEIKVLDENDVEVADGERGELVTRGPYTIRGYYNAPENNARAFTTDGFYRMGDIVTKRGRTIFCEGRKGDLINRGGEKISIDEVENLILKHLAVHSVALVAMPDATYGERACACIVLRPGETLSFDGLVAFLLDQRIAKFKLPERLELFTEFPISGAGKIMRRTLREVVTAKCDNNAAATKVRATTPATLPRQDS